MSVTVGLDADVLRRELDGGRFVRELIVLDAVDSTNDEVRRRAAMGSGPGTVVIADRQNAGRGRLGRDWHSPPGLGLYLSMLLRPGGRAEAAGRWTLGAAVAACEAARELSGVEVTIRWPNDLLYDGRKLGGILAEMRSSGASIGDLVIGVGFNVHHAESDFPEDLRGRATSLLLAGSCAIVDGRERLAALFLRRMGRVGEALERGEWAQLAERWEALAPAARGTRVRVVPTTSKGARGVVGRTDGLDASGALRIRTRDGATHLARIAESILPLES